MPRGGVIILIDGKIVSSKIRDNLKVEVQKLNDIGVKPGLAVIIVGHDPASQSYVKSKENASRKLGFYSLKKSFDEKISEEDLLSEIIKLNNDPKIHGILVQLPLPKHINEKKVIETIIPEKDVDGFHPINAGKLLIGEDSLKPCTPFGIMRLLEEYNIDIESKKAVVIGRSNIVGKPISLMLLEKNATVTICHSRTKNLEEITRSADIVVVALGVPKFLTGDMVKDEVIVIDVGINRVDGKIVGDVDFDAVKEKASYITPVPGGVGPMTITMLMENTVKAARKMNNL